MSTLVQDDQQSVVVQNGEDDSAGAASGAAVAAEGTRPSGGASHELSNLQKKLLSMTGGTLTAEEVASEQRVVSEIVDRLKRSLVRQDRHHHLYTDAATTSSDKKTTATGKKHHHHRLPPSTASRSFLIPCIFDGHRAKPKFPMSTPSPPVVDKGETTGGGSPLPPALLGSPTIPSATAAADQREARARSLMDGIVSFHSLLQQFHDELFGAMEDLGTQFLDSKGEPLGKHSMNCSMSCVHLKEAQRKDIGEPGESNHIGMSDNGVAMPPPAQDAVVVTQAFDVCEAPITEAGGKVKAPQTKPELHYNHPFLDTTVHTTFTPKAGADGGDAPTANKKNDDGAPSFFVPRWTCGKFHDVDTSEEASKVLTSALDSFHSNLSSIYQQEDDEDEEVDKYLSATTGHGETLRSIGAPEGEVIDSASTFNPSQGIPTDASSQQFGSTMGSGGTTGGAMLGSGSYSSRKQQRAVARELSSETLLIQYRVLRCNGDAPKDPKHEKDRRRLFSTVLYFVLTPSTGSFVSGLKRYEPSMHHAPTGKGRSAAVLDSMRRAFDAASQSFWHPLLDEVIVHNVACLTAIGAGEGAEGAVAPATQSALSLIRSTLATEQKRLFKKHRELQKTLEKGGANNKDGKLNNNKTGSQAALFCHSPPDGVGAEKVLAKAKVAIQLAASIMNPYRWILELIHPDLLKLNTLEEMAAWLGAREGGGGGIGGAQGEADGGDDDLDTAVGATVDSALLLDSTLRDLLSSRRGGGNYSPVRSNRGDNDSSAGSPNPHYQHNQSRGIAIGDGVADPGSAMKGTSCEALDTSSRFVSIERHEEVQDEHATEKAELLEEIERLRQVNKEWAAHHAEMKSENQLRDAEIQHISTENGDLVKRNLELEELELQHAKEKCQLKDEVASLEQRLQLFHKLSEVSSDNLKAQRTRADMAEDALASSPTMDDFERSLSQRKGFSVEAETATCAEIAACQECLARALKDASRGLSVDCELQTEEDDAAVVLESTGTHAAFVVSSPVAVQTSERRHSGPLVTLESRGVSPVPMLGTSRSCSPVPGPETFEFGMQAGGTMDEEISKARADVSRLESKHAEMMAAVKGKHAKELLRLQTELDQALEKLASESRDLQDIREKYRICSDADAKIISDLNAQLEQMTQDKLNLMKTLRAVQAARQDDMETATRATSLERDSEAKSQKALDERDEERRHVKKVSIQLQNELERLKRQIEELEALLYEANNRNQTLTRLVAMQGHDSGAQGEQPHFHAHCVHPAGKPDHKKLNPSGLKVAHSQITAKNPRASDQLSTVSAPLSQSMLGGASSSRGASPMGTDRASTVGVASQRGASPPAVMMSVQVYPKTQHQSQQPHKHAARYTRGASDSDATTPASSRDTTASSTAVTSPNSVKWKTSSAASPTSEQQQNMQDFSTPKPIPPTGGHGGTLLLSSVSPSPLPRQPPRHAPVSVGVESLQQSSISGKDGDRSARGGTTRRYGGN